MCFQTQLYDRKTVLSDGNLRGKMVSLSEYQLFFQNKLQQSAGDYPFTRLDIIVLIYGAIIHLSMDIITH